MKSIPRIKRPPRRIKINGSYTRSLSAKPKPTSKPERPPISTSDGRMNEVAAANYLGLAVSTLQNRRSMGEPPKYRKPHGRVFYHKTDLDTFLGETD